jgi:DNA-binding NarL/FixJ family response regulator
MIGIFLVCDQSMFGQGLCALVRQEPEFDLLGQASDPETVREQIEQYQPDVILAQCNQDNILPHLLDCLGAGQVQRVITVDLDNNSMCVFTGDCQAIAAAENLISAIREAFPGRKNVEEHHGQTESYDRS